MHLCAENYSAVVQDSIQSFHWTGQQSTVHPFIVYYKEDGVLKTISSAVISDRLKHDTLSVFAFKSLLIEEIRRRGIPVDHIHYVSDGSAAHQCLPCLTPTLMEFSKV